jgi:hypothetical protein
MQSNTKEKKKKLNDLIKNEEIENTHPYLCECETCLDFTYLKVTNFIINIF